MQPMLNIALRAARQASSIILRAYDRPDLIKISKKGDNDFVTETDKAAESAIIDVLHDIYPDHTIIGEESGLLFDSEESEFKWIIDPLDGTTNFVHGFPHFAISIACMHKNKLEHAVILDPIRNEEFTASRGRGAQLNGKRIRVSQQHTLIGSLLGTGFPFKPTQQQYMQQYLAMFSDLASQTAGIRRAGSAALDLAYVASGRLDAFWEIGLNQWDIAGGALLIQEAGGLISDFRGGNNYLTSGNIVCGNPKLFKSVLQTIQPHLNADLNK